VLRFPVPIYCDDAWGPRESTGSHSMFLPHEIVGTFYRYAPVDLMVRLTGQPGEPQLDKMSSYLICFLLVPSYLLYNVFSHPMGIRSWYIDLLLVVSPEDCRPANSQTMSNPKISFQAPNSPFEELTKFWHDEMDTAWYREHPILQAREGYNSTTNLYTI